VSGDIPKGVKAAILRAAADARYPNQALPTIAANHNLGIAQVKSVVEQHGWPQPDSMRRAADILARAARRDSEVDDADEGDVYLEIAIERLQADPENVREDLGDLAELMDSMVREGLVQPVVARRHQSLLIIVSGHRRHAAAVKLGWTHIPCLIKAGVHPDDVLGKMLIENGQRKDLDPIEEARALQRLKTRDRLTDAALGSKIGRSQPYVSGRLALLDLPPAEQERIREGTMTLAAGTTAGRRQGGHHRPGAQGKKSAAHLTSHHPLARAVAQLCQQQGHSKHTPGRVGGVGCGRCWEDVIRSDERSKIEARS